jgi:hypothetical protein
MKETSDVIRYLASLGKAYWCSALAEARDGNYARSEAECREPEPFDPEKWKAIQANAEPAHFPKSDTGSFCPRWAPQLIRGE